MIVINIYCTGPNYFKSYNWLEYFCANIWLPAVEMRFVAHFSSKQISDPFEFEPSTMQMQ